MFRKYQDELYLSKLKLTINKTYYFFQNTKSSKSIEEILKLCV